MKNLVVGKDQNLIEFIIENKSKFTNATLSTMDESLFEGLKTDYRKKSGLKKTAIYSSEVGGEKYSLSVIGTVDTSVSSSKEVFSYIIQELSDSHGKAVYGPSFKIIKHNFSLQREERVDEKE